MSSKIIVQDTPNALIQEHTNEVLKQKHNTEIGQKVIVQREQVSNEATAQLKEVLQDIGKNYLEIGAIPKGMQYLGSLAVHIYVAPNIRQQGFVSQIALENCPEVIASDAMKDLKGSAMGFYSRARQKLRSGF